MTGIGWLAAVGIHGRMYLARIQREHKALKDRLVADAGVAVMDSQHRLILVIDSNARTGCRQVSHQVAIPHSAEKYYQ